jgi:nitrite reductase (NO-forming)
LSAVEAGPGRTPVPGATPPTGAAETPAAGPAATTEVTIGAYDIYFDPMEVTIPANTDVTVNLPNNGATLHNFSVTDHNNPDVPNLGIDVDLAVGTTETITIDAPAADYYFFCNVPGHEAAGMFGTLHVV